MGDHLVKSKKAEAVEEYLDKMYLLSYPPISWDRVVEKYSKPNPEEQFYTKHFLNQHTYEKIKKEFSKEHNDDRVNINMSLLNYAPTSVQKYNKLRNGKEKELDKTVK